MPWVLYILLCDQKTYYIGITSNLTQRLISHQSKYNLATKEFSDLNIIYKEEYQTRQEAERRERQLKGWTFVKKKALVKGNLQLLSKLSKTREIVEVDNG